MAVDNLKKLAGALARNTGQEESECVPRLFSMMALLLQRGLAAMLANRVPNFPGAEIDGILLFV